jgi:hypothetical protein
MKEGPKSLAISIGKKGNNVDSFYVLSDSQPFIGVARRIIGKRYVPG